MDSFELGPDVITVLLTCGTCLHPINVSKYDHENEMSPFWMTITRWSISEIPEKGSVPFHSSPRPLSPSTLFCEFTEWWGVPLPLIQLEGYGFWYLGIRQAKANIFLWTNTLKLWQQLRRLNLMSSPWITFLFLTKPPKKKLWVISRCLGIYLAV